MPRTNQNLTSVTESQSESSWEVLPGLVTHQVYHELADRPVVDSDALSQLEANVVLLEDLNGRLSFLMREVRGMLKA